MPVVAPAVRPACGAGGVAVRDVELVEDVVVLMEEVPVLILVETDKPA